MMQYGMVWKPAAALALALAVALAPSTALGFTWEGDVSSDFWNGANWVGGTAPHASYPAPLLFPGDPAAAYQPNLGTKTLSRLRGLTFEQAGWTISGTGAMVVDNPSILTSAGNGINRIETQVDFSGYKEDSTLDIATGNTLAITGSRFQIRYSTNTVTGGGTLAIDVPSAPHDAYNSNIVVQGATLLANNAFGVARLYVRDDATGTRGVFGGTGEVTGRFGRDALFEDGSTLAPGGDGTFGDRIGTLRWNSALAAGHIVTLQSGSMLAIDYLNATADKVEFVGANANVFTINPGATLALNGSTDSEQTYTLVAGDGAGLFTFNGMFSTYLLNDEPVDPATDPRLDVSYANNALTVTIVPEPATLSLLGIGMAALALRRRR